MNYFTLSSIPASLDWPKQCAVEVEISKDRLAITAQSGTDWFDDPSGGYARHNATVAFFSPPDACFCLAARVTVDFASIYDAGVLLVHERDDLWAKLCFELSPQRQPMIVSVVTRGVSGDCNSGTIQGDDVHLRIYRHAETFAFHHSLDGQTWQLVRYFTLGALNSLRIGFSAQSPTGQNCRAVFSEIRYQAGVLMDIRSGA